MKHYSLTRENLPKSGIRAIMELSASIPDVIHLEVGEPNVDTPAHINRSACEAIKNGFTHYTPNIGFDSTRAEIALYAQNKYKLDVGKENIAITTGAVAALHLSLLALVDSSDEVLIPDPGWPNYEQMILSQEATPVRYRLDKENNFLPDFKQLEEVVTSRAKAIIINTPSNPTGGVFDEETIHKIIDFAKKHDLYVISDEVYDGIIFEGEHICAKTFDNEDRVISIFSFSKNYAMTGWRLGYAIAPETMVSTMAKTAEGVVSCPSSISQKAAEAALTGPQDFIENMKEVYLDRRDKVCNVLEQNNLKVYEPQGAFYIMIDLSKTKLKGTELALKLLENEKVAVAPGSTFGESTESMVRISLATETSLLLEGIKRICNFAHNYKEE